MELVPRARAATRVTEMMAVAMRISIIDWPCCEFILLWCFSIICNTSRCLNFDSVFKI